MSVGKDGQIGSAQLRFDTVFWVVKEYPIAWRFWSQNSQVKATFFSHEITADGYDKLNLSETLDWANSLEKKLETQLESELFFVRCQTESIDKLIMEYSYIE